MPGEYSEDTDPKFLFQGTDSSLLSKIVKGEINAKQLAWSELRARGSDINGNWVGFGAKFDAAAKKGLGKPYPARTNESISKIKLVLEKLNINVEKEFPLLKEGIFGGGNAGGFKPEGIFAKSANAEAGAKQNQPPGEPLQENREGLYDDEIVLSLTPFELRSLVALRRVLQDADTDDEDVKNAIIAISKRIDSYR